MAFAAETRPLTALGHPAGPAVTYERLALKRGQDDAFLLEAVGDWVALAW
jgi:hypothetical protein